MLFVILEEFENYITDILRGLNPNINSIKNILISYYKMMTFRIFFILVIIFIFPLLLKGDNDFANIKLNIKLDEDNIIKIKHKNQKQN